MELRFFNFDIPSENLKQQRRKKKRAEALRKPRASKVKRSTRKTLSRKGKTVPPNRPKINDKKPPQKNSILPKAPPIPLKEMPIETSVEDVEEEDLEKARETWWRPGFKVGTPIDPLAKFNELPFLPWGDAASDVVPYNLVNTCPMDNGLMILTALFEWFPSVKRHFQNEAKTHLRAASVVDVVRLIQSKTSYNAAKVLWIQAVHTKKTLLEKPKANNLWSSEVELILEPLKLFLEKYIEISKCPTHGVLRQFRTSLSTFTNGKMVNILKIINTETVDRDFKCIYETCSETILRSVVPTSEPCPFQVFHADGEGKLETIPVLINVHGIQYHLFCATVFTNGHFVSAFPWDKKWIIYDGTKRKFTEYMPQFDAVSLLWYVRVGKQ